MPVSIAELAAYRGAAEHSEAEYARVGIAYVGGCHRCGRLLDEPTAAFPSVHGFWFCGDCIADKGYEEVDVCNLKVFGRFLPGEVVLEEARREAVRLMYQALQLVNHEPVVAFLGAYDPVTLAKVQGALESADELLVGI